jgi:hypothetical protein
MPKKIFKIFAQVEYRMENGSSAKKGHIQRQITHVLPIFILKFLSWLDAA